MKELVSNVDSFTILDLTRKRELHSLGLRACCNDP